MPSPTPLPGADPGLPPSPSALERMAPLDRLHAAISVLQMAHVVWAFPKDGEAMWGASWMPRAGLEIAIALLLDLQEPLERVEECRG